MTHARTMPDSQQQQQQQQQRPQCWSIPIQGPNDPPRAQHHMQQPDAHAHAAADGSGAERATKKSNERKSVHFVPISSAHQQTAQLRPASLRVSHFNRYDDDWYNSDTEAEEDEEEQGEWEVEDARMASEGKDPFHTPPPIQSPDDQAMIEQEQEVYFPTEPSIMTPQSPPPPPPPSYAAATIAASLAPHNNPHATLISPQGRLASVDAPGGRPNMRQSFVYGPSILSHQPASLLASVDHNSYASAYGSHPHDYTKEAQRCAEEKTALARPSSPHLGDHPPWEWYLAWRRDEDKHDGERRRQAYFYRGWESDAFKRYFLLEEDQMNAEMTRFAPQHRSQPLHIKLQPHLSDARHPMVPNSVYPLLSVAAIENLETLMRRPSVVALSHQQRAGTLASRAAERLQRNRRAEKHDNFVEEKTNEDASKVTGATMMMFVLPSDYALSIGQRLRLSAAPKLSAQDYEYQFVQKLIGARRQLLSLSRVYNARASREFNTRRLFYRTKADASTDVSRPDTQEYDTLLTPYEPAHPPLPHEPIYAFMRLECAFVEVNQFSKVAARDLVIYPEKWHTIRTPCLFASHDVERAVKDRYATGEWVWLCQILLGSRVNFCYEGAHHDEEERDSDFDSAVHCQNGPRDDRYSEIHLYKSSQCLPIWMAQVSGY